MDSAGSINSRPAISPTWNLPQAQLPPPAALQDAPPAQVGDQVTISAPASSEAPSIKFIKPDEVLSEQRRLIESAQTSIDISGMPLADRQALYPALRDAESRGVQIVGNGMGALAQLEDFGTSMTQAASAGVAIGKIEGPSTVSSFSDLHLVGPGNAAEMLRDPSKMYLGI